VKLSLSQKFLFVIQDNAINIRILQHDIVVDWTRYQCDVCPGIAFTQCAKQRNHTEHVAQLVVLADNEDAFEESRGHIFPLPCSTKEAEEERENRFALLVGLP
jgi:hypothetical protein